MAAWYHVASGSAASRAALALALLIFAGCGGQRDRPRTAGVDDRAAPAPATPAPSTPAAVSALPTVSALRELPALSSVPTRAPGHLDGHSEATLHMPADVMKAYVAHAADSAFPEGTWIAEFLQEPQTLTPGPVLAMKRTHTGWDFAVAEPNRALQLASTDRCRRCHAEASRGFLFGPPKDEDPAGANPSGLERR